MLSEHERKIARAGGYGAMKEALAKMGDTLLKLPPGKFLGYGMEAGMDGVPVLAVKWAWTSREGLRRGAFSVETGEYLTELLE